MNKKNIITGISLFILCMGLACSEDNAPSSTPWVPISGTITAKASGITGQSGMEYVVSVFEGDWQVGSPETPVGWSSGSIDTDPFSISQVVMPCDELGRPLSGVTEYEPGEYSVVFYVRPAEMPHEYFTWIHATVDASIVVTAPAWSSWTAL